MSATLTDLLEALAGVPPLPGARCRGHHRLFDPAGPTEDVTEVERRHRIAVETCCACPALAACGDWLASLPPRERPPGVIAGTIRTEPRPRNRKKATA